MVIVRFVSLFRPSDRKKDLVGGGKVEMYFILEARKPSILS
jgi:hypothetical protein